MTDKKMPNGFTEQEVTSCVYRGELSGYRSKKGYCG